MKVVNCLQSLRIGHKSGSKLGLALKPHFLRNSFSSVKPLALVKGICRISSTSSSVSASSSSTFSSTSRFMKSRSEAAKSDNLQSINRSGQPNLIIYNYLSISLLVVVFVFDDISIINRSGLPKLSPPQLFAFVPSS